MNWLQRCPAGLLFVSAMTGCHAFDHPRPVQVRVIDAETHAPVVNAAVKLSPLLGNGEVKATAGKDGLASITPRRTERDGWTASVTAVGYLPEVIEVDGPPEHAPTKPPAPSEVAIFAGPLPSLKLTLPVPFQGPVNVTWKIDPQAKPAREFTAAVSPNGSATLVGPPVLKLLAASAISAQYADGRPLKADGNETDTRFQWVKTSGQTYTFFVGTNSEYEAYRKNLYPTATPPRSSAGSGGGGRRGGRGGMGGGRGGMGGGGMGGN